MRHPLYKYNAETCQYERVKVKTFDVIFYACGVIVMAIAMLAGMLALHDFIFDSKKELALRKENKALESNYAVLTSQLSTIEGTLASLEEDDKKLHAKFFNKSPEEKRTENKSRKHLLLADPRAFSKAVDEINSSTDAIKGKTLNNSYAVVRHGAFTKKAVMHASTMPNIQPVRPWQPDNLLSGFGMRINPFHKGLYEHPGIDIAAVRGTEVISTAAGRIIQIKKSDLQAGYGNYIEVDHGNGFITRYAHLEEIRVKLYQKVDKGSVIATSGNSGGSIAPHLHYEIVRNGINVNPVNYLVEGLSSDDYHHLKTLSEKHNQSLD
jgi:murein DD-endopeptidase MepM/ murein hydrolase activator NlpD